MTCLLPGDVSPPHQVEEAKTHSVEQHVKPIVLLPVTESCFDLLSQAYSVQKVLDLGFQFLKAAD